VRRSSAPLALAFDSRSRCATRARTPFGGGDIARVGQHKQRSAYRANCGAYRARTLAPNGTPVSPGAGLRRFARSMNHRGLTGTRLAVGWCCSPAGRAPAGRLQSQIRAYSRAIGEVRGPHLELKGGTGRLSPSLSKLVVEAKRPGSLLTAPEAAASWSPPATALRGTAAERPVVVEVRYSPDRALL
jgi:hypothetical protein